MSGVRPEVGDLVVAAVSGTKWVCTDIAGLNTQQPVWLLRPLYGTASRECLRVGRSDLVSYPVVARRGEWIQP
ncbi:MULTISPECIES: hypothetical protein [unclassified Streptomyces]|uniref:hypothetical protein n=1 Tax=unclassified Streptomyces TaxID=2593676 RepID=UPI0009968B8E|nr:MULTISPECIES: hypothetical protein [unclassified Streptomyces]MYT30525.1 hypothetical protein [Streptomyces sp. SID8354]